MPDDLICSPAISDAATVTGAATSGDLTVAKLQDMQPGAVCRFASLTGMYTEWDLGSAQTIEYIWQRSPNITSAGTVRTRAATSQANLTAAPDYDSTALTFWTATGATDWDYHDFHLDLRATPKTYRYWRFDWADAANPDGYLDLSRAYLANPFEAPQGVRLESLGPTQAVVRVVSQGSDVYPAVRPVKNTANFVVHFMTHDQAMANMFELARVRGTARDILVILACTTPAYLQHRTVYGLADEPYLLTNETVAFYDVNMSVTEL